MCFTNEFSALRVKEVNPLQPDRQLFVAAMLLQIVLFRKATSRHLEWKLEAENVGRDPPGRVICKELIEVLPSLSEPLESGV